MQDSFNFKCMCIYTEDYLTPFGTMMGSPQISLKEVYMRKNGNERYITDNQKICRLCLQIINGSLTSLLEEREFDIIQKYVPEIVSSLFIKIVNDTVIYVTCLLKIILTYISLELRKFVVTF